MKRLHVISDARTLKSYFMTLANLVVPIFIILYIAKNESLELSGRFFILMSTAGLVQLIVDYGFNLGAIRQLKEHKEKSTEDLGVETFFSILFIKILIILILTLFLMFFNLVYSSVPYDIWIAFILGSLVSVTNVSWLYIGMLKVSEYYALVMMYRVIFCIPIFFIDHTSITYLILILVPMSMPFIHGMKLIISLKKDNFSFRDFSTWRIGRLVKANSSIFVIGLLVSGISLSWPLLLSSRLDLYQIAVFGFADRIIKAVTSLFSPIPPLVISGEISITNTKLGAILIFAVVVFTPPLIFMAIPLNIVKSVNIEAFTILKESFSYLLFLIPLYLTNMFAYTYLLVIKKEAGYGFSVLFAALIGAMFFRNLDNFIYVPLYFEIMTLSAVLLYALTLNIRRYNDRY